MLQEKYINIIKLGEKIKLAHLLLYLRRSLAGNKTTIVVSLNNNLNF